jgi:hypothetical protein
MKNYKKCIETDDSSNETILMLLKIIIKKLFETPLAKDEALMDLLDEQSLADKLGVHKRTVKNYHAEGLKPRKEIRKKRFYHLEDVEQFLGLRKKKK